MFGFLCSSQKLLYVLGDLLCLTDDVLCTWQGGIILALLSWVRRIGGVKGAAIFKEKITHSCVHANSE